MKKIRRVLSLVLCVFLTLGCFAACAKIPEDTSSDDGNANVQYTDILTGLNDTTDTGLAEYTDVFEKPILTDGRVWALGWSWEQADGAQEPINTPLLVGAAADGSDAVRHVLQLPEHTPEEGWVGTTSPRAILADVTGALYLISRFYQYPEDTPANTASEESRCSFSLHGIAADGTVQSTIPLPALDSSSEVFAAVTAQDSAWLLTNAGVFRLSLTDGKADAFPLPEEFLSGDLLALADGSVLLLGWNGRCYQLATDGTWSGKLSLPAVFESQMKLDAVQPAAGDVAAVAVWDGNGIWQWDMETEIATPAFRWLDSGVDADLVLEVFSLGEGRYLLVSMSEDASALNFITLTPASAEVLANRTVITVGSTGTVSDKLRKEILSFNGSNEEIFVQLVDYSADENGTAVLENDIITNNAPDVLLLPPDLSNNHYIRQGLYIDLYPLLDADPVLKREDFIPNILRSCEFNGYLPTMTAGYNIMTAIADADTVGTQPGWTMEEFHSVCAVQPSLQTPFFRYGRNVILLYHLRMGGSAFIDYAAGEAHLDTPEFAALLEACRAYPTETITEWVDPKDALSGGKSMLFIHHINNFDVLRELYYIFDGDYTFKGFPGSDGSGSAFLPQIRFGITNQCKDPQAAWQFLRRLLLPEFQDTLTTRRSTYRGLSMLPVRQDSLTLAAQNAAKPVKEGEYQVILVDRAIVQTDNDYWRQGIPAEQSEKLISLIEATDVISQYDDVVLDILFDEADAFYNGSRSAADTAAILQNRIQTYLDEQG